MEVSIYYLLFLFIANCSGSLALKDLDNEWYKYKNVFNKKYTTEIEDKVRKSYFEQNIELIAAHNRDYDLGLTTYTLGLNQYADMTNREFLSLMTGLITSNTSSKFIFSSSIKDVSNLPRSVDWRKKGVVTPIKDQGACGSCWAFSAVGSVEGAHAINTGNLISLSEQNLVDCSKKQGNEGCNGGWMDWAFEYIIDNQGIDTEQSYPYKAQDGPCRFDKSSIGATISKYVDIKTGDEIALQQASAQVGPISVAIDADGKFQFYKSGVYNNPRCSTSELDHGVLVVGYGDDGEGNDFWIVKNSWGTSWGMQGYILMARNKKNQCGIATKASYPVV